MKTLSVSMIVRNESSCLRQCLESVKGADEIVIVDTGSKDNTIEIAKEYTDKVYSYTGCNDEEGYLKDFSDARNKSLSYCTKDYVLIIDADEVLVDSIKGIKSVLNSGTIGERMKDGSPRYLGMAFIVKTKTEILNSLRVFRNDPNIRYIYPFHNQLSYSGNTGVMRQRSYQSRFKIDSGYSAAHNIDPDRTLRMINHHLKDHPEDPRSLYYQGREFLSRMLRTKDEEKMEWLDKTIDSFEKMDRSAFFEVWTNEYADGLFVLSNCYIEKMAIKQDISLWYPAVACSVKAVMILPTFQAPMLLLAQLMAKTPVGFVHRHGVKFWSECAKRATNEDVAFIREVPQIIKKA